MTSQCWCGNTELVPFSPQYLKCPVCKTLVTTVVLKPDIAKVVDDDHDFYGREYWFSHQEQDLGFTNITQRARTDLPERCLHWLQTTLKYKLPPGCALELGGAHGGFTALLKWAGFDATGLELSPWVVRYAHETFDIPMLLGPIEDQLLDPGSLDIIALMDVLEHLPDPVGTMRCCLDLLKPDGVLIIQTPCYPPDAVYEDMVERNDPFLEQLKANQHLYLFSQEAVRELFRRLGAEHLEFQPAIFAHYDMFLVVSRAPLVVHGPEAIADAMSASPPSRLVQALLDLDDQFHDLGRRHAEAEADRVARLAVIQSQAAALGRVPGLENQLAAAEADRAARLAVIQSQAQEIQQLSTQLNESRQRLSELRHRLVAAEVDRAARLAVIHRQADQIDQFRSLSNHRIVRTLVRFQHAGAASPKQNGTQDGLYQAIRAPKQHGGVGYTPEVIQNILNDLSMYGYDVKEYTIDVDDYWAYFEQAGYKQRYPHYYSFNLYEKSLEHYIAARLLNFDPGDVYIDIASEGSPVPEIYHRLFGCTTYRQDLSYPEGLNGDTIGGDAAAMPVSDNFASKMALHCSFEHFEGDADMRFIREADRVLRPGGAVCIVPFYLFDKYIIQTDPDISVPANVPFEDDAIVYCRPNWNNRHGRFYDPAHLTLRLHQNLNDMHMTIYKITNARAVDPSCYAEFATVITKP